MAQLMPPLGAPGSGGLYHPATDHIELSGHLPQQFPRLHWKVKNLEDVHRLAPVIEEFVHHFQFCITQVGLVYRLICLAQTTKVLQILRILGAHRSEHLAVPWGTARSRRSDVREHLVELRALEVTKQFLFGERLGGDPQECVSKTKAILEEVTPLRLGAFKVGYLNEYYDTDGQPKAFRSTRAILESHASAYAFRLLERYASRRARAPLRDYIATNRVELYRSIEELGAQKAGLEVSLEAALRLGDEALAGGLILADLLVPVESNFDAALPYQRYFTTIHRHDPGEPLVDLEAADFAVRMPWAIAYGDDLKKLMGRRWRKGSAAIVDKAITYTFLWGSERSQAPELTWLESVAVDEIMRVIIRFFRNVGKRPPFDPQFEPTRERFGELCRACDPSVVRNGPELKVFFSDGGDKHQQVKAEHERLRFMLAQYTEALAHGNPSDLAQRSGELTAVGLLDAGEFLGEFGASVPQLE